MAVVCVCVCCTESVSTGESAGKGGRPPQPWNHYSTVRTGHEETPPRIVQGKYHKSGGTCQRAA